MKAWHRVVIKFGIRPLVRLFVYLETFIRTRWEIIPVEQLPAAIKRWKGAGMDREQVSKCIDGRHGFLCPDCDNEVETTRHEADEIFTDVWEVRKYGRCEQCAADCAHCSRIYHGYLSYLEDGRWMAIFPRVPLLRRLWLMLCRKPGPKLGEPPGLE